MSDDTAANREVVERFFAALSSGDLDQVAPFFTEESRWIVCASAMPGGGAHTGAEIMELLRPVRTVFAPGDPKILVDNVVAERDWVMVEARGVGELVNGAPYRNDYSFHIQVRDGKVHVLREYMDTLYIQNELIPLLGDAL